MHGVSHLNRLGSGDAWDRVTTFIIANMLWMVFAAPVITIHSMLEIGRAHV